MFYRSLIRAHLEWATVLFADASLSYLRQLDTIQYSALRAVLGCMKSTPIPLLLSEANGCPLRHRSSLQ